MGVRVGWILSCVCGILSVTAIIVAMATVWLFQLTGDLRGNAGDNATLGKLGGSLRVGFGLTRCEVCFSPFEVGKPGELESGAGETCETMLYADAVGEAEERGLEDDRDFGGKLAPATERLESIGNAALVFFILATICGFVVLVINLISILMPKNSVGLLALRLSAWVSFFGGAFALTACLWYSIGFPYVAPEEALEGKTAEDRVDQCDDTQAETGCSTGLVALGFAGFFAIFGVIGLCGTCLCVEHDAKRQKDKQEG